METLKQGMAFKFELHCKSNECLWYHTFFNSKRNNKKLSVQSKVFDINPRAVYSMRRCGNGYANLTRFLMLMNHRRGAVVKGVEHISTIVLVNI